MLIASGVQGAPELRSGQAILIDLTTNTILYEKNADQSVPPSSMSKMMTVYLIFSAIKRGDISRETTYLISEKAWRKGGSKMFVKIGSQVSVEDLLRGVIIQSGNDAAIALAEGYAGAEEVFAEQMNRLGKEIGLKNSHFVNATGWPDPEHLSTVRDLALIAIKTIENFPEFYSIYREKEFAFNGIKQMNRNPLLYTNMGADGLKTGHTDAGGYGLVASAVQGDRRLVLAINGAKNAKERAIDAEALMGYGFTAFVSPKVLTKGHELDRAEVWLGAEKNVPLMVDQDVFITIPRDQLHKIKVDLVYKTPIEAPLRIGQEVGRVVITLPNGDVKEIPLKTAKSVDSVGFFGRIFSALTYLLKGHN
jgi:D-alanyl-D-alanine carboxypeptidase (penicillin-binding protein 5/6)